METDTNEVKKLASACDFVILVTTHSHLVADSDLSIIDWLGSGTKTTWSGSGTKVSLLGLDVKATWLG